MRIFFRVDASLHIGSGHVMRCLTLADALAERGGHCVFISREHEGTLRGLIRERGHSVSALPLTQPDIVSSASTKPPHALWLGSDWLEDAAQTKATVAHASIDWLIVDHYALDIRWERELRPFCNHLMVIDDLADREHDCDLLLDQNLGRAAEDYVALVPKTARVLLGPHYALLRPEFRALRAESLARRSKGKLGKLLVSLGGVDQHNITERVLEALDECGLPGDVSVTVVMGRSAPWLESVKARAFGAGRPTHVLVDVKDMAQLLANCDLVIGGAGTSSWERACLGVPAIAIVMAENQRAVAAALAEHGIALNVGNDDKGPTLAAQAALRLYHNPEALIAVARAGPKLCDGNGTRKIGDFLMDHSGGF